MNIFRLAIQQAGIWYTLTHLGYLLEYRQKLKKLEQSYKRLQEPNDCYCGCHDWEHNAVCGECYRKSCAKLTMKGSQSFTNVEADKK